MRRELPVADLPPADAYRLLTASIIPRPIAWVSSRSAGGVDNLAPHSFFTVASAAPPVIQFTSIGPKDSLANVTETREFVVCLAPLALIDQINLTSARVDPHVDEFDFARVEREPSAVVAPPRVAGSPVALECALRTTLEIGNGIVVLGDVLHIAIDEAVLAGDGLPVAEALGPVARLGRDEWAGLGELLRIERPHRPRA
ncbi:MAG: flavin reductase family protein [Solirubrobacteraceae bacterium]|nr:flavin reductase family protein [Solirubrobacteraceae bacterium]